jgi:hypothetical protein
MSTPDPDPSMSTPDPDPSMRDSILIDACRVCLTCSREPRPLPRGPGRRVARRMASGIGTEVQNFEADTQLGRFNFFSYISDQWTLFFSHPADFTPVCATVSPRHGIGRRAGVSCHCDARGLTRSGRPTGVASPRKARTRV